MLFAKIHFKFNGIDRLKIFKNEKRYTMQTLIFNK